MHVDDRPVISNYKRTNGIAGQYAVTALVTYPNPDESHRCHFVGNSDGGPIVAVLSDGLQVWINTNVLDRIGRTLDESWIRRFYGIEA